MKQDEINALGIAFFSGKTLQYLLFPENKEWSDWIGKRCPYFDDGHKWRIKPDEPKKEIWCTFRRRDGVIGEAAKDSREFMHFTQDPTCWTHIPSLDREVILPEGFE